MVTARTADPGSRAAVSLGVVPANGGFLIDHWLPHEFSFVANRFSAALEKVYSRRFGLSVPGWRVIAVLANHAPLSAGELSRRTAMNPVAITRAVAELARLGMVKRRVDARDRRKAVLRLSDRGIAAYRTVIPVAIRMEEQLLSVLSPSEIERLRASMNSLARHAQALFGQDAGGLTPGNAEGIDHG